MIRLSNLSLSFGDQLIFNNTSALFQTNDKIGIVGPNGAGKSTLLKVIAGQQKLNGGKVSTSNGLSIAYFPQEIVLESKLSIFDETMQAFGQLGVWHLREQELRQQGDEECAEYAHLHADLAEHDHGSKCARARRILIGLGFEQDRQSEPVSHLSIGWRMRVVLAKLLLQDADMYLFDEPTNHLDLPAREWLCGFLEQASFGYLLISHDRYVLDQVCEKTVVVRNGMLKEYSGNYSYYRSVYEEQLTIQKAAKMAQDREIEQKQKTIERFKAKANKAKMAQSMLKQLARIERIEVDEEALPEVALPFPPITRAGNIVLKVCNLAKSFGDKQIFSHVSFEIERGQRVAIVAPNGAGKTTLLSCIYNAIQPDSGSIHLGHNVHTAVFEQEQVSALDKNKTVLEEVEMAACASMRKQARAVLGALLFSGDTVNKKIKVLSGGERNRVALAKVLVQDANFLLLDEPTNHLDLLSQQVLADALSHYTGTLLFVSHDRDVVEKVATTVVSLDHGKATLYPGNYESFLFAHAQRETSTAPTKTKSNSAAAQEKLLSGGDIRDIRKQLQKIEREIGRLESEETSYASALGDHEYGSPAYETALKKYESIRTQITALQKEWEAMYKELEA